MNQLKLRFLFMFLCLDFGTRIEVFLRGYLLTWLKSLFLCFDFFFKIFFLML